MAGVLGGDCEPSRVNVAFNLPPVAGLVEAAVDDRDETCHARLRSLG